MKYIVREIYSGKFLSSEPYGFTGGQFSINYPMAIEFQSLKDAYRAAKRTFNCGKLQIVADYGQDSERTLAQEESHGFVWSRGSMSIAEMQEVA